MKDSTPSLVVPAAGDRPRWTALPKEIAAANETRTQRKQQARKEFEQWLASAKPETLDEDIPCDGLVAHVPLNEGAGNEVDGVCGAPMRFKATGEVSWTPDGKLGPAPVMKAGATFDLGDLGDFEKNQTFSYGAWVKAGRNGRLWRHHRPHGREERLSRLGSVSGGPVARGAHRRQMAGQRAQGGHPETGADSPASGSMSS